MNKKILMILTVIVILILIMGLSVICLMSKNLNYISNNGIEISTNNYNNFNRMPENVTIEIDENTITTTSVSIIITDNNENPYVWGVNFRMQKKVDGEWYDLKYITDTVAFIEIACRVNTNNQLNQKINWAKYYGELSKGVYRVVKPIYDNGDIYFYSNEFVIK